MNILIGTRSVSFQIYKNKKGSFGEVVQDLGKTFQNVLLVYIFSSMSLFSRQILPKDLQETLVVFLIVRISANVLPQECVCPCM